MLHINKTAFQKFSRHSFNQQLIASMVVSMVGTILSEPEISGYVKNSTIMIQTNKQHLKIKLFLEKNKILAQLNEKLEKQGYSIKFKNIISK
ncbi:MAG TPA: hypothetical protein PKD96_04620 [Candidatus Absconditabacterales bacterium]|nr:hypothetical protein [Candidatus Absconditabacterales bacterium]HMT27565.1 hypothetical protein [Candidatus Absconditabacterales bacterium]